jgi:hypothetical protein
MRMIGIIADKLLGAVVPEIKAAACCTLSGKKYTQSCGCLRNGVGLQQNCVVDCDCQGVCGSCYAVANAGCR